MRRACVVHRCPWPEAASTPCETLGQPEVERTELQISHEPPRVQRDPFVRVDALDVRQVEDDVVRKGREHPRAHLLLGSVVAGEVVDEGWRDVEHSDARGLDGRDRLLVARLHGGEVPEDVGVAELHDGDLEPPRAIAGREVSPLGDLAGAVPVARREEPAMDPRLRERGPRGHELDRHPVALDAVLHVLADGLVQERAGELVHAGLLARGERVPRRDAAEGDHAWRPGVAGVDRGRRGRVAARVGGGRAWPSRGRRRPGEAARRSPGARPRRASSHRRPGSARRRGGWEAPWTDRSSGSARRRGSVGSVVFSGSIVPTVAAFPHATANATPRAKPITARCFVILGSSIEKRQYAGLPPAATHVFQRRTLAVVCASLGRIASRFVPRSPKTRGACRFGWRARRLFG
jgi:hypothetical protein